MFKCKACECRQKTITVLEEQNEFLRSMLQPKPANELNNIEADAMLSGHSEVIEIKTTSEQVEEAEISEELRERDLLLSGSY